MIHISLTHRSDPVSIRSLQNTEVLEAATNQR